jgi:DMSO/TMAO reductase YedYZ heme-binding membrane subunit
MNESTENNKNAAGRIIAVVLLISIGYAIVRYHIAGTVPWKDLPFFILNKGISLAAFILLTFNFGFGPLNNLGVRVPVSWLNARRALGMTGFLLVLIHVLMSFMLFKPAVYAKFFATDGTLTLLAGLSMLGGILAFVVLWAYNMSFQTHLREDKKFIAFITSPAGWQSGLPPISLVAISFGIVGYGANLLGRK